MNVTKLVGVMGSGLIGRDPYEENAWSGSSRYFFQECDRRGVLHRAFGVEVRHAYRVPLILRNFSFDRRQWRHQFYLDTKYYELLSKCIVDALTREDLEHAVLQIGGIYNLKQLIRAKANVYSYHDGNLAQAFKSPYFPTGISRARIQKALDYEKSVYENLDMIFTMSDYLKDSFINDFKIEEKKIKTIGAGINLDPIPEVSKKDYGSTTLTFIGVDFHRKGGLDVLRAFRSVREKYPKATLNVVGPRNLTIASEYASGVIYHGFLSKRDPAQKERLEKILRDSVLFLMPSHYEPFGIAPLEAMTYQIPCVLTDAWAFPEMVKPGVNGDLVKLGDVNELTDKIIDLLQNPDQLQTMGKAARESVLRKYTWQHVVSELIKEIPVATSATF